MNATNQIRTEAPATYNASAAPIEFDHELIRQAKNHLISLMRQPGGDINSPAMAIKTFFQLELALKEHEVFGMMLMDNRNRLIEYVELFRGTINAASVFPREVVKEALARNAAAVVLVHNHPSGVAEPSQADRNITDRLVQALGLVEIRVIDHIVVGGDATMDTVSFAERGYI
jgi:DNA repair protein RadC